MKSWKTTQVCQEEGGLDHGAASSQAVTGYGSGGLASVAALMLVETKLVDDNARIPALLL